MKNWKWLTRSQYKYKKWPYDAKKTLDVSSAVKIPVQLFGTIIESRIMWVLFCSIDECCW